MLIKILEIGWIIETLIFSIESTTLLIWTVFDRTHNQEPTQITKTPKISTQVQTDTASTEGLMRPNSNSPQTNTPEDKDKTLYHLKITQETNKFQIIESRTKIWSKENNWQETPAVPILLYRSVRENSRSNRRRLRIKIIKIICVFMKSWILSRPKLLIWRSMSRRKNNKNYRSYRLKREDNRKSNSSEGWNSSNKLRRR